MVAGQIGKRSFVQMTSVAHSGAAALWQAFRGAGPDALLRYFGIQQAPIDPFAIASALGAKLLIAPNAPWDGALEVKDVNGIRTPHIYVSGNGAYVRQRFTCAHELGHLMLHDVQVAWRDTFRPGPKT